MDRPIGKSFPRKEGRKKVTGQALYVDDLSFPEMLHGATVRSPAARGRIKNISFEGDIPWDEFTIVTEEVPPMLSTMIVPLDGSDFAARVLSHAAVLARSSSVDCTITNRSRASSCHAYVTY